MDYGVCNNCGYGDYNHSSTCAYGVERDMGYGIVEQCQKWSLELESLADSLNTCLLDRIIKEMREYDP